MSAPGADRLRRALEELHSELERSGPIGPDLEQPLREVLEDILAALEGAGAEGEPPADSLAERLQEMALEFETEHPTLAGTINRLTHALSSMGI